MWDWALTAGSFIPARLWGVAIANLVRGVPIDAHMNYTGNLFTLLNPYTIWSGITMVLIFLAHGAYFLNMKTAGTVQEQAESKGKALSWLAVAAATVLLVWSATLTRLHPSILASGHGRYGFFCSRLA